MATEPTVPKVNLVKLTEGEFVRKPIERGYTNQTIHIDLSKKGFTVKPVSEEMKKTFTGGKGFDLKLLWDAVPAKCPWDDPRNEIVLASGPLGGSTYPGAGKSIVVGISPLTGTVCDSNVGGFFGPYLKFSGFDAIEVQGIAEVPMVVMVDGDTGKVTFFEGKDLPTDSYVLSEALTEHFGESTENGKRAVSVVTAGYGAKNSFWGCVNISWYDTPRKCVRRKQAGRGGLGTVFACKNILALCVKCSKMPAQKDVVADIETVQTTGKAHAGEIRSLDQKQNDMARIGTTHLIPIMNDYDLLPVNNFQYGKHDGSIHIGKDAYRPKFHPGYDGCWIGCPMACAHCVKDFIPVSGPFKGKKVWVDGPEYETIAGCGSNCGVFDADYVLEVNFYCDTYGLDTISFGTGLAFVMELYTRGVLKKEHTGGLDLSFGNKESGLEVLHQIAEGRDFGKIVGRGIRYMKKYFAEHFKLDPAFMQDIGMESKGLEYSEYVTKESLAQQGGYGLALKGPQHDEAWLIFLDMVHNYMPTFEQKAEALHWFPMWRTWFGLCGLCKLPWNDVVPEDNKQTAQPAKVIKHLEWYMKFYSGVTGHKVESIDELISMSERVYNFQKIFNVRQGYGTRDNDVIPYRSMGPVTNEEYESRAERYDKQLKEKFNVEGVEKMATPEKVKLLRQHREAQYELLKDAVYKRRGWNKNGVPTLELVKRLGIDTPEVLSVITPLQ